MSTFAIGNSLNVKFSARLFGDSNISIVGVSITNSVGVVCNVHLSPYDSIETAPSVAFDRARFAWI
jgi:hypothetical protein